MGDELVWYVGYVVRRHEERDRDGDGDWEEHRSIGGGRPMLGWAERTRHR